MYRDDPATADFILDDYLANPDPATSSAGGSITFSVSNIFEGHNNDNDFVFTWMPADPMNGVTLARPTDQSNGVVFDWSGPAFAVGVWLVSVPCRGLEIAWSFQSADATYSVPVPPVCVLAVPAMAGCVEMNVAPTS